MSFAQRNSISAGNGLKDKNGFQRFLFKYVPAVRWLPHYTRLDALSDFVAGITLGLTMIPQSIAYAALAGLSAQYGLYSSFVGAFVYLIFGTIKEVSIGATSLMAILTLEYTRDMPVEFVVLLTFLAGCVELAMGVLNLGFLVDFISVPVTSGFTSAASIIIIVSQFQGLLGIKFKSPNIFASIMKLFQNVGNIRLTDMALGVSCIIVLLFFRKLKDLKCLSAKEKEENNDSLVKTTLRKIPWLLSISRNAIVVLLTSVIALRMHTAGSSPFILSGKVVQGLPQVSLPPFSSHIGNQTYTFIDMCMHYKSGLLIVPIIAVLTNVAIAKTFASGAAVNASQEMLTLGFCNILGSFFSSMPTCGAFTRSAVSSASGIRTPMAGLYSAILTLLALSFLTPYFYFIPRATLSAVLISAVVFLIDWKIVKLLWKGCKTDAIMAIATFVLSLIWSVEIGLIVGVFLNLLFLLRPAVRPNFNVTECKSHLGNKYMLLEPDTSVCFPAVEAFCSKVMETAVDCITTDIPLIVDCKFVANVDYTSIKGFERVSVKLNREKHRLYFLNIDQDIVSRIEILADINQFHFIEDDERIDDIFQEHMYAGSEEKGTKLKCFVRELSDAEALNQNGKNHNKMNIEEPEESETLLSKVQTLEQEIQPSPPTCPKK